MALIVINTTVCRCTHGAAPSSLVILPRHQSFIGQQPVATIMDHKPLVNIMPFGVCSHLANPTVASATAAAMGALTPMPCVPNTPAPWIPGCPKSDLKGEPVLHETSKLNCVYGGVISIESVPQKTCNC